MLYSTVVAVVDPPKEELEFGRLPLTAHAIGIGIELGHLQCTLFAAGWSCSGVHVVVGAGAGAGAVAAAAARAVAVAVAVVAVAVAVGQPKCWAQVESAAWVQETGFRHFARAVGQDSEAFLYPPNTKDLGSVPVGWRAGRGGGDRPRLAGHRAADRGGRPRGGARMQRQKGQQGR